MSLVFGANLDLPVILNGIKRTQNYCDSDGQVQCLDENPGPGFLSQTLGQQTEVVEALVLGDNNQDGKKELANFIYWQG